jgi:hypothetical protein
MLAQSLAPFSSAFLGPSGTQDAAETVVSFFINPSEPEQGGFVPPACRTGTK